MAGVIIVPRESVRTISRSPGVCPRKFAGVHLCPRSSFPTAEATAQIRSKRDSDWVKHEGGLADAYGLPIAVVVLHVGDDEVPDPQRDLKFFPINEFPAYVRHLGAGPKEIGASHDEIPGDGARLHQS